MVNLRKDGPSLWAQLLGQSLDLGVTEIHVFPPREVTRIAVRMASGGELARLMDVERSAAVAITQHLKQLAALLILDLPIFQVGDFTAKHSGKEVKATVSTCPMAGEGKQYLGDQLTITLAEV